MSEFKAGDLALIIGSPSGSSPNIGKCVHLHERVGEGESFTSPKGDSWAPSGAAAWAVHGDGVLARAGRDKWVDAGGYSLVEERFLMPLRGDFQPERQKSHEVPA